MGYDAVFLHAPSVYDFRKKPIFYGPVSDVIPSSPVFEMYPVGFMTISAHLEQAGFKTRIVNIAKRMLDDDRFDAERMIRSLKADVFFIDLHWMPHAHGALALANIVRRYHPDSLIEFGGLTSSYFWEELIQRPEVDLVMRGDTTEIPTVRMMKAIKDGGSLEDVPNLVWKDKDGRIHNNGLTYSLQDLDEIIFDYGTMIKTALRARDIKSSLPWSGWEKVPLTSVFTVRGCSVNCAECGGSHTANKNVVCRNSPAFRSPEKLAEDMAGISSYMGVPIFIVGDIRQAGTKYADRFLDAAKEYDLDNHVVIEFFNGANREFLSKVDKTFKGGWSVEFSPDSHDEEVRFALGKGYTNEAIENSICNAFECGCSRFDIFYMNGLPFQSRESALYSAKASERLWSLVDKKDALCIYNAPFAPFVDPGSRIFEDPAKWGYKLYARTLEEHRQRLDNPSWKYVLSYETDLMSRDDIADVSYDAADILTDVEYHSGRMTEEGWRSRKERTDMSRSLMAEIDEVMKIQDAEEREAKLWETKERSNALMNSTICDKQNLDWDTSSVYRHPFRVAMGLLKSLRH